MERTHKNNFFEIKNLFVVQNFIKIIYEKLGYMELLQNGLGKNMGKLAQLILPKNYKN